MMYEMFLEMSKLISVYTYYWINLLLEIIDYIMMIMFLKDGRLPKNKIHI